MRNDVWAMLDESCAGGGSIAEADDSVIMEAGFMRAQDARALSAACRKNDIVVSFRAAGADTIRRIEEHHPCKGHEILHKTIKPAAAGWTYLLSDDAGCDSSLGAGRDGVFETLRGFVGKPYVPLLPDGSPDMDSADRPPVLAADGRSLLFHLDGVYLLNTDRKSRSSHTVKPLRELLPADLPNAYTGDYDMHDLICKGRRVLATTPEEQSALDKLNLAILAADSVRSARVETRKRCHESPYALIRHGAQTSYFDFLLSCKGEAEMRKAFAQKRKERADAEKRAKAAGTEPAPDMPMLPFGDSVIKIDDRIAVFDNKGRMFILQGAAAVYRFYRDAGLRDEIPFYYFFHALRQDSRYAGRIDRHIRSLNGILETLY